MKLDPEKTTMLTLDFQKGIFALGAGSEACVPNAAKAVDFARKKGFQLIHVGLGFDADYPEVSARSPMFGRLKPGGLFLKGSDSGEFDRQLARPGDLIVYKQRVGAFSENQLDMILRARGTETLVFFGIATSGIVLSTIRRAFDLDYSCVVLKDACFDSDEEVHRVLTEKIFPKQGLVMRVEDFISAN